MNTQSKQKNIDNSYKLKVKYFFIRLFLLCMWLGFPALLMVDAQSKYTMSLGIILIFMLYSHLVHTLIFRRVILKNLGITGIFLTVLFGPTQLRIIKTTPAKAD